MNTNTIHRITSTTYTNANGKMTSVTYVQGNMRHHDITFVKNNGEVMEWTDASVYHFDGETLYFEAKRDGGVSQCVTMENILIVAHF